MSTHLTYRVASTLNIPTQGDPTALSIGLEGTLIAVGGADGHVFVWYLRTYKLLCQISPPPDEYGVTDTDAGVTNMVRWRSVGLMLPNISITLNFRRIQLEQVHTSDDRFFIGTAIFGNNYTFVWQPSPVMTPWVGGNANPKLVLRRRYVDLPRYSSNTQP